MNAKIPFISIINTKKKVISKILILIKNDEGKAWKMLIILWYYFVMSLIFERYK